MYLYGDLNVILIRFASEAEFEDTLRSFGLIEYNSRLVYIPTKDDMSYSKILFHALSSQNELNNIARLGKEWILENCKISNFEEYLT